MAVGVLAGFTPTRLVTTAATTVRTGPCYVTARLINSGTASVLTIHNASGSTSAASQVSILRTFGRGADETGVPIRCDVGVTVKMSVNTSTAFIYIR